ncbi:MAG TPA: helix-turn-helix domain-containing protein, partial [Dehalococcoidia bacterium]
TRPEVQPTQVIEAVSHHLSVPVRDIRGPKRTREATYARHISMYLLRQDAGLTYTAIAQALGKKDHSTVVHACRQLELELEMSPPLRADLDAVRSSLRTAGHAA